MVLTHPQNERSQFAASLKSVLVKYSIRSCALAAYLKVSPQYVSRILTSRTLPSRQQTGAIQNFLESAGVSGEERKSVMEAYIVCKTGFDSVLPAGGVYVTDLLEMRLISDFRRLSPEKRKEFVKKLSDELIQEM